MANENVEKTKDFRLANGDKVGQDALAGPTQPPEVPTTEYVRDIGVPFMKDFRGTDPDKNFMPMPVDSDAPIEEEVEYQDPKDLSALESADSSQPPVQTEPESKGLPASIADAVKGSTPPKGNALSMPPS